MVKVMLSLLTLSLLTWGDRDTKYRIEEDQPHQLHCENRIQLQHASPNLDIWNQMNTWIMIICLVHTKLYLGLGAQML